MVGWSIQIAYLTLLLGTEFDVNGDGVLDEVEFREGLERINIQFDDVQFLATFAYFDPDYAG